MVPRRPADGDGRRGSPILDQCPAPHPLGAPPDLVRAIVANAPRCPGPAVVVAARTGLTVHRSAGGPAAGWIAPRTQFGSPVRLPVVRRAGRWVGVVSASLPNGAVGWVRASSAVRLLREPRVRLVVVRSRRVMSVLIDGRLARRITVGVGSASSPTPTGRFAITDKLDGSRFSPVYGCCILALSGHQPRLPAGWRGGDRLAIHGGAGAATSAGCLHAGEADLRYLMRRVPLGAVVTIRA